LVKFVKNLPMEVFPDDVELASFLVLPNLLLTTALAKRLDYVESAEISGENTMKPCCNEELLEQFNSM
jgi:hypothetical protein